MDSNGYRDLAHRLFDDKIKARELKAMSLPVGGKSNALPRTGAGTKQEEKDGKE